VTGLAFLPLNRRGWGVVDWTELRPNALQKDKSGDRIIENVWAAISRANRQAVSLWLLLGLYMTDPVFRDETVTKEVMAMS
jgi:hypothetical protein